MTAPKPRHRRRHEVSPYIVTAVGVLLVIGAISALAGAGVASW